ncbi:MAG: hypothetical protein KDA50_01150 [Rhodobacteraceae bacterium]|nr:hypothetical protein [Paracoccaceae bacterium]
MLGILARSMHIATRLSPEIDPDDILMRADRAKRRQLEADLLRQRSFLGRHEVDPGPR